MNKLLNISFRIKLEPSHLSNNIAFKVKQITKDLYNHNLYKDCYINNILDIKIQSKAKVNYDGCVIYHVDATCDVIQPLIDEIYNIQLTNVNKMGALWKYNKITFFIPKQYFINEITPNVDDLIKVQIIGKRLEENMICIAKPI